MATNRIVLVMLSNRFTPLAKPRHVELEVKRDGSILKQHLLRSAPRQARFDEVWVNDDGKRSIDDCTRFKRIYRHRLEKKTAG
jgi:hypothetical protein